ncbi:MAG: hypothetical protein ABFS56_23040 [Pseudomonadota bacterium]
MADVAIASTIYTGVQLIFLIVVFFILDTSLFFVVGTQTKVWSPKSTKLEFDGFIRCLTLVILTSVTKFVEPIAESMPYRAD